MDSSSETGRKVDAAGGTQPGPGESTRRGESGLPENTSEPSGRFRDISSDPARHVTGRDRRRTDFLKSDNGDDESELDEDMDLLVDPSFGGERMSNNRDVLDLNNEYLEESEEPSFTNDPGTTDMVEVVENGETFFAPTDPPRHLRDRESLDGFASTTLEDETDAEDGTERAEAGDEELAERVRYALATDSYTADLDIEVEVAESVAFLTGKVRSLDDILQAEEVAGSVPGVDEVEEDLEIV